MVAVPAETPETTPVPDATAAIAVLLLLHVPPPVASVNVVVDATHRADVPPIAAGSAFTVIVFAAIQPDASV